MRRETGKRKTAPKNRPLQPLKRQGNMTFGQPRKLCLLGGVLPRAIEHRPPRSTLSHFSRSVFSTPYYFRGRPKFRVLGRFEGALRPRATSCSRLHVARFLAVSRVSVIPGNGLRHSDNQQRACRAISCAITSCVIHLPRRALSRGGGCLERDGSRFSDMETQTVLSRCGTLSAAIRYNIVCNYILNLRSCKGSLP